MRVVRKYPKEHMQHTAAVTEYPFTPNQHPCNARNNARNKQQRSYKLRIALIPHYRQEECKHQRRCECRENVHCQKQEHIAEHFRCVLIGENQFIVFKIIPTHRRAFRRIFEEGKPYRFDGGIITEKKQQND